MNLRYKSIRHTALLLSVTCLLAFAGCEKQPVQSDAPTGETSDILSVAVSSLPSFQALEGEAVPSTQEPPVSSQEDSSPSSQAASPTSQPDAPTGENSDILSVVVSSFPSSQAPESEVAPSMEELPVSSQEAPSTEKPPVSNQESPSLSSQATPPVSQPVASEPSQPEIPTIPFVVGERVGYWNSGRWQPFKATIVVIRSMTELKALYEQENRYDAPENYGKYNDAFFEEHAIVFVGQQLPSGSCRTRVNYLTRSGNQLIVDYSTLNRGGTCDVVIWQNLLEVSKVDLEGVTEIVSQYHEVYFSVTEGYDESEWKQ